ncbi:UNVERIFIED_CONTAM: hypothetical protein K2H54_017659 [Gekko kuhli]
MVLTGVACLAGWLFGAPSLSLPQFGGEGLLLVFSLQTHTAKKGSVEMERTREAFAASVDQSAGYGFESQIPNIQRDVCSLFLPTFVLGKEGWLEVCLHIP